MIDPDVLDYVRLLYSNGLSISSAQISAWSGFVSRAKANSYWSNLIEVHPMSGTTVEAAKYKLKTKSGGVNKMVETNSTLASNYYSERAGFSPDGNGALTLDCGQRPDQLFTDLTADCMFAWYDSPAAGLAADQVSCGCFNTVGGVGLSAARITANVVQVNMGSATFDQTSSIPFSSPVFLICNRTASNAFKVFADGVSKLSGTRTASAVNVENWQWFGRRIGGGTGSQQTKSRQAFGFLGQGFDDAKVALFNTDVQILLQDLRRK